MNTINAIFVDAKNQTIANVQIKNNLQSYYDLIGCKLVEYYNIDSENDFILDEEGNLKENQSFFVYGEFIFAGNVLIVGFDSNTGNTVSTNLKIEDVKKNIEFLGTDYLSYEERIEADIIIVS